MMMYTAKVRRFSPAARRGVPTAGPRRRASGTLYGPDGSVMDPGPWDCGISRHLPYPLRGYGQHNFHDGSSYEFVRQWPARRPVLTTGPRCCGARIRHSTQRTFAGGRGWRVRAGPGPGHGRGRALTRAPTAGQFHGEGTFTHANGDRYTGEWHRCAEGRERGPGPPRVYSPSSCPRPCTAASCTESAPTCGRILATRCDLAPSPSPRLCIPRRGREEWR